jgi:hypothetical protein
MALMELVPTEPAELQKGRDLGRDKRDRDRESDEERPAPTVSWPPSGVILSGVRPKPGEDKRASDGAFQRRSVPATERSSDGAFQRRSVPATERSSDGAFQRRSVPARHRRLACHQAAKRKSPKFRYPSLPDSPLIIQGLGWGPPGLDTKAQKTPRSSACTPCSFNAR